MHVRPCLSLTLCTPAQLQRYDGAADVNHTTSYFDRAQGHIRLEGKATQTIRLPSIITLSRQGGTLIFTHKPPFQDQNYGLFVHCVPV